MNFSDLNEHEVSTLRRMRAMDSNMRGSDSCWIEVSPPSAEFRQAIDILVLAGLAERREDPRADPFGPRGWVDQWRLTPAGIEVADCQPQTYFLTS